ncbi:unnamed protein product [Prorocentrum cordatum]|uniref:Uncharacterized protein n=1 Tax=Prorocentrum cordatum TaxID=2364126 RepID=A0ABN9QT09_9DINO|nr:unnamed protein product [Polarella glacialis]
MLRAESLARALLFEHKGLYFAALIAAKGLALLGMLALPGGVGRLWLELLGALASGGDIVLRLLVSSKKVPTPGKHGVDALLCALLLVDVALCGHPGAAAPEKNCRALKFVVPFATLVSIGGNLMRLDRGAPPSRTGAASHIGRDEEALAGGE